MMRMAKDVQKKMDPIVIDVNTVKRTSVPIPPYKSIYDLIQVNDRSNAMFAVIVSPPKAISRFIFNATLPNGRTSK